LALGREDGTIKLWNVSSTPPGTRLAVEHPDGTVKLFEAGTGREALTLTGHTEGIYSVAFSPDGKRLASASADATVKLWDAATGRDTHTLEGHTGHVWSVAFSPDGTRLASAGTQMGLSSSGTQKAAARPWLSEATPSFRSGAWPLVPMASG
jgi:WD40 repeat protein